MFKKIIKLVLVVVVIVNFSTIYKHAVKFSKSQEAILGLIAISRYAQAYSTTHTTNKVKSKKTRKKNLTKDTWIEDVVGNRKNQYFYYKKHGNKVTAYGKSNNPSKKSPFTGKDWIQVTLGDDGEITEWHSSRSLKYATAPITKLKFLTQVSSYLHNNQMFSDLSMEENG